MARVRTGDLWQHHPQEVVVVTTNIGWNQQGQAVMGRGVARQAADKYPGLLPWYGQFCQCNGPQTPAVYLEGYSLILAPTKGLNTDAPNLSWQADSDIRLIWRSCAQLASLCLDRPVALPLLGCGNGNLTPDIVLPIYREFLGDRFTVLVPPVLESLTQMILAADCRRVLYTADPRPNPESPKEPMGTHEVTLG